METTHTAYRKDKLLTYNGMLLQTKQNHVSEENINFTDYNILTSLIFDYNKEFEYRANSIIKVNDVFYIAKKDVPKNIELNNYEYWSKLTGNINLSQWQPNQKYMIGDIVVVDSNIYRAKENHSSESFITNKWDKLTNNMHPFIEEWKAKYTYKPNNLIIYENNLYIANIEHSSEQFNSNKWKQLTRNGYASISLLYGKKIKATNQMMLLYTMMMCIVLKIA